MSRQLYGPPGMSPPIERYFDMLMDPNMRDGRLLKDPGAIAWRRRMCKHSPILFALYYLREHVKIPDGRGNTLHALSEFHVTIAMAAKEWTKSKMAPKECRHAWIAPRHAAKSTWLFLILALWCLAYGHRKFIAVYADTEDMAMRHLSSLKREFDDNDRLRRDFPELCTALRVDGRKAMDNAAAYLGANGNLIMVKGMNSATLGVKYRERRPDALFFDDVQPKKGNYSIDRKEKRLEDLLDAILPCNDEAVVQLVGTSVMHGCIVHDLIEGKPWVGVANFQVHYFPGIVEDPVTGEERSCWPQKWSLEYLRSERITDKRGYAKNFENRPVAPDGTYWDDDDIVHDASMSRWITERVLVVDPAAKAKKSNDETGIGMLGWAATYKTTVVERVIGVRLKPAETRELVLSIVRSNGIHWIIVDVTNGGDHVLDTFAPLPSGVKILSVTLRRSKADRFARLHGLYQNRKVVHARPIPTLESQEKAWSPRGGLLDDRIDAVALGDEYFRGELSGQRKVS